MISRSLLSRYRSSWAVVIGINAYRHIAPLSYACNDADAVASALINDLGFAQNQLVLLKDSAATKQAILDTYLGFSENKTDPDDRVLVFFAGHGTTFEGSRGQVGYLVPVDGRLDNKNTLIRWDDLTRNAELIPAKHVLFIMDACYSGLAIQRAIRPGTERFLRDMLQRPCRQVITAGKADETVADGGGLQGNNSIFTGYLLEGFKGAAADANGVLTANSLMAYVYQKVGQDNRSRQTPHYGQLEGDGDFVLRTPNNEHLSGPISSGSLAQMVIKMPEHVLYLRVPLLESGLANADMSIYKNPPFGDIVWFGVPFQLQNARISMADVFDSDSKLLNSFKPLPGVQAVHFLINAGDGRKRYLGQEIGWVNFRFKDDEPPLSRCQISLGENVREWAIGNYVYISPTDRRPDPLVDTVQDRSSREVWRGETRDGQVAVIDMLSVVPDPTKRDKQLHSIEFVRSVPRNSIALDYFISGITIEAIP